MVSRVRFAPSPTGSLHLGSALTAAASRAFGDCTRQILEPEPVTLAPEARATLERFRELSNGDARAVVREPKAAGADLKALRLALTGRERGPELWTMIRALSRGEALRRIDAAL